MLVLCATAACPNVTGSHRICKPTGKCILSSQICDSVQHCPDDSDEVNCSECILYSIVLHHADMFVLFKPSFHRLLENWST